MKRINIAIDGPAGAGKSTAARKAAKKLGIIYVDTGALYRAVSYYMVINNIDTNDEEKVSKALNEVHPELKIKDDVQYTFLNGVDVSDKIRTNEISMAASKVSAYKKVRTSLLSLQRDIAARESVIMDGRDIGTNVLPNADIKIYLTASSEKRAERRYKELLAKGEKCDFDEILKDIEKRDYDDMHRSINPLKRADDAILLDSSDMNEDEVVETIIKLANEKRD